MLQGLELIFKLQLHILFDRQHLPFQVDSLDLLDLQLVSVVFYFDR